MLRVLMLVTGLLLAPNSALAGADAHTLLQLAGSVLKIEVARQQGGFALGSGVVVGPERVVTNCHVTHDARGIQVLRGGLRWRADAQMRQAARDLCLLRVPGLDATAVSLGRASELKARQAVTAIGFTGGMGMHGSAGNVVALHDFDGARVVQSDNAFTSGASGGGLFDDRLRLVGVLTFRLPGAMAHYFSAPAEWLAPMLQADAGFVPVAPGMAADLPYWQQPPDLQPLFLQATLLQRDHRWRDLQALAQRWLDQDPGSAAPWYLSGLAHQQLGLHAPARRAFERALQIDPAHAVTWLQLGLLLVRQGELQLARQAQARLDTLDANAALELGVAIGRN